MSVATNQMGEIVQIDKYANSVGKWLEGNQRKLEALLPRQIRADRFIRLVVGAIRRVPKLALCSKESLIDAMLEAAALGLDLDTALGHCYVLPYKNHGQYEATFILGYKGLNSLMYRSGLVKSARAFEVFERDVFEIDDGASNPITHKRCLSGDPGRLIGFASRIETSTGGIVADFMSVAQVEAIRKRARAGDSGPWVTDFNEMGKKTVLKRNAKYAPMSSEAARAVALDEAADANLPQSFSMSLETVEPKALPEPQVEPMPSEVVDAEVREVAQPPAQPAHVDAQPTIPPPVHLPGGSTVTFKGGPKPIDQATTTKTDGEGARTMAMPPVPADVPVPAAAPTKPTKDYNIKVWGDQSGEVLYEGRCEPCPDNVLGRYIHNEEWKRDNNKWDVKWVGRNNERLECARAWRAWKQSQATTGQAEEPPTTDAPDGEQSSFDSAF